MLFHYKITYIYVSLRLNHGYLPWFKLNNIIYLFGLSFRGISMCIEYRLLLYFVIKRMYHCYIYFLYQQSITYLLLCGYCSVWPILTTMINNIFLQITVIPNCRSNATTNHVQSGGTLVLEILLAVEKRFLT